MKHYIYKTTSSSGKFYIGRHSSNDDSKPYYGSGKWVKQIKDKSQLTVEILEYADSFDHLLILEEKYISKFINDPNNMNFNNNSVGFPSGKLHHAHTEKFKEHQRNLRNGKTFEELFGAEEAIIIKEKISEKAKGRKRDSSWNAGLTKESSDSVRKISDANTGRTPWNKGKKTGYQSFTGKKHSPETIEKIRSIAKLDREKNKIKCDHCNRLFDKPNYARYHGNNCKFKV